MQELENGEFRADTLSEVVGKDEVDPDVLTPMFDSKEALSVKKGSSSVPLPTGPEQLRRRLSIMQNCMMMLAIKHVTHEELRDVTKDLLDRSKDYILGDYVWGLSSTDLQGHQIQTPPWSLVLTYETAIRKKAFAYMQVETIRFGEALEKAWKCPATKERHFITPLALYAKRSYPVGDWNPNGKGKGKDDLIREKEKEKRKERALVQMARRFAFVSNLRTPFSKGCHPPKKNPKAISTFRIPLSKGCHP